MTSYNVSHKFCDDGSMSSAIVKMFQPENTIVMTGYNDGWKKTEYKSGDYILFTDFCPKPEDLWDLYNQQIRFQVLDHHISSINNLEKYKQTDIEKYNQIMPYCKIDQNGKCGATMTWDWFNNNEKTRPEVLKYIEIADTWAWDKDENSKHITQYIRTTTHQGSWKDMKALLENFNVQEAIEKGKILSKRLERDVEAICNKAHFLYIDGMEVLSVNSGHDLSISEVGHELSKKSTNGIGLIYNIAYDEVKISIRGQKGTSLARELAEKLGGGGHNEASAARCSIETLMTYFKKSN